jgi:hypothetical protein
MLLDPGAADPRSRTIKQFIYSLIDLCKILLGSPVAIAHFSALDGFSAWVRALGRLSTPRAVDGKTAFLTVARSRPASRRGGFREFEPSRAARQRW